MMDYHIRNTGSHKNIPKLSNIGRDQYLVTIKEKTRAVFTCGRYPYPIPIDVLSIIIIINMMNFKFLFNYFEYYLLYITSFVFYIII